VTSIHFASSTTLVKCNHSVSVDVCLQLVIVMVSVADVGVEQVISVTGYFCKLCHKFYNNETMARITHCKTQPHFDKYLVRASLSSHKRHISRHVGLLLHLCRVELLLSGFGFWAAVCITVCPMLSDHCLSVVSVMLVYCGQTDGSR